MHGEFTHACTTFLSDSSVSEVSTAIAEEKCDNRFETKMTYKSLNACMQLHTLMLVIH